MKTESIYYTYLYLDPRKPGKFIYNELNFSLLYEPFYIGKGKGSRDIGHMKKNRLNDNNSHKTNRIKSILRENTEPYVFRIIDNVIENNAHGKEIQLIKSIGRRDLDTGPLTNLTDGGEGSSGAIRSDETRRKISENHADCSGKNNSFYGKTHSDTTKRIIGEKTRKNRTGTTHSEETKRKMSQSSKGIESPLKGRKYTEEEKKKLYSSRRGKPKSKEHNKKNGEGVKRAIWRKRMLKVLYHLQSENV